MALRARNTRQYASTLEPGTTAALQEPEMMKTFLQWIWFQVSIVLDGFLVHFLSFPAVLADLFYLVFSRPCKDIKGEIALVTGSGQGLGRELALLFARQGCEVICVDIMEEQNEVTAQEVRALGAKARAYTCNVADRTAIMKLATTVGRVDILINNAGIIPFNNFWTMTEQELRNLTDINYLSHFWAVQAFVPAMRERDHGHVVCISSMSGLMGWAYAGPYASTKFAVAGLMKSLSLEMRLEKKNVKMTTVFPYFIQTRPELQRCIKTRIPYLNVREAAEDIFRGIRQNLTSFTVPRYLNHIATMLRIYPESLEDRWIKKFYVNITENSGRKRVNSSGTKPRKSVTIASVEVCS